MRLLALLVASAALFLSACSSTPDDCGEIAFSPETVDFGDVLSGQVTTRRVELKNVGDCAVQIDRIEQNPAEGFSLDLSMKRLEPGESAPVEVTFDPGCRGADLSRSVVVVHGEAGEQASIELTGRPVTGTCEGPTELDFGNVALGEVESASFTLRNPTAAPMTFTVLPPDASSPFSLAAGSPSGEVELAPDSEREVVVEFRPTRVGEALAELRLQTCACGGTSVKLTGRGVDQVLRWDPATLDFKYVSPGVEVTREITFSNAGPTDVQLSQIKTLNSQEFWVVAAAGADATRLTVPRATRDANGRWVPGTAKLTVANKPLQLGPRQTQLQFQTSLPRQATGFVTLKGFGGGPDIQVTPAPSLNFGKVAYFAGANSFQKRKLTIMNVGTAPGVPDVAANLRLGKDAGNGDFTAPYYEVIPLNDTQANEFEVIVPATYNAGVGLEAKAGKNTVDFEVKVTPTSVALKAATIRIFSNDPDEPVVEITATADAQNLPPCNYTVTPTQLSFGLIAAPDFRDLSFQVKNNGTGASDICLLSSLDLAAGSNAFFSLPYGPVGQIELAPGSTEQFTVRVHPQGQTPSGVTNITGRVEFHMSSPVGPQAQVALSAQVAPPCLAVLPDTLDFGTVQTGCSSATRSVNLYNTCSAPLIISSFALHQPGGPQPGGPSCPGASPCPEFHLVQTPAIPAGGLVLNAGAAPEQFQAKYRPIDLGPDTGVVAINATQNGTNVTYVVTMDGRGDTQGIHTDVFTAGGPQLDVLFVIDDGPTMVNHQLALAQAVPGFLQYAATKSLDLHIAVTTTGSPSIGAQGEFIAGTGHPQRVLTASTPNLSSQLMAKVQPGGTATSPGSCLDAALKALTPPLTTWTNAGFLRPGAALSIICVSDRLEAPTYAGAYYRDAFIHRLGSRQAFNAVNGFSGSCAIDDGTLKQVGDLRADICSVIWPDFLADVMDQGSELSRSFVLTSDADTRTGSIAVSVNTSPVSSTTNGNVPVWHYDDAAHRLVFEPLFAPTMGDAVEATYPVTCHP